MCFEEEDVEVIGLEIAEKKAEVEVRVGKSLVTVVTTWVKMD